MQSSLGQCAWLTALQERVRERKHYFTQRLFHEQPKPLKGGDHRHFTDRKNPTFAYKIEGEDGAHYEQKGLRHDCEAWYEKGHPEVCQLNTSSLILH